MHSPLVLSAMIGAIAVLALPGSSGERQGSQVMPYDDSLVCASVNTDTGIVLGQGFCSWHGGECGCSNGRDLCCDGTLSPSCTCHE